MAVKEKARPQLQLKPKYRAPRDPRDWWESARCRLGNADTFFDDPAAAKAICAGCPSRVPCLEWALATGQQDGVYAGLDQAERAALRQ
jgi:WhiB family redox-sensing transcriptional regulator